MIKRFLIAIVFVAVVVGGIVGFNMFRNQAIQDFFANQQQPAFAVDTVVAEAGQWRPGIEAIGTVYSARGIDLAVETNGVVQSVGFTANDRVEEGQLLVQINDAIERADLLAAQAQVRLSEQALERAETLRSRGVSAESNVEEARAAAASARAQVVRLQSILGQKALEAPFAGTIGLPQVEAGQYVTAGTTVATLQDLDTLRVDFSVPEQTRRALEIGQPVTLSIESAGIVARGEITGIEPRIDPQTRLVRVRAEVDNQQRALAPGQFVRVRVVLEPEEGIIAVPQTAVVTSLYGDYVYAVREPEEGSEDERLVARQVFVEQGRRNGGRVEIVEGLEPGDRIVVAGQNRLSNGVPVTLSEDGETTGEGEPIEAAGNEAQQ